MTARKVAAPIKLRAVHANGSIAVRPRPRNGSQGVLQTAAIFRLLPYLHVGDETIERAAPIGARPRMGSIEALIAGLR
ncbi:MAG TPA: hypothetical protein VGL34_10310 [Steroidobacteraceae bacterium]|jgi:hypothetical protein